MKFTLSQTTLRQQKADAVAFFVTKEALREELKALRKTFGNRLEQIVGLEGFEAKGSEVLSVFTERKIASPRMYLVGLGETSKLTIEQFRRSTAAAVKQAQASKLKSIAFSLPPSSSISTMGTLPTLGSAILEGAALSQYQYDKYFTDKNSKKQKLAEVILLDTEKRADRELRDTVKETRIICEATILARDLENAPGNEMYPAKLAEAARESAQKYGYRISVWDNKRLEELGFGGLLAVNSGSAHPARFIIMEHNASRSDLDTIILVGKGITFDSGGISIKPSQGMAEMKMDMSGAAAVIGAMEAATRLDLPIHLVGLVPSTENMPSGTSMRPGDVIIHYGGKTSEVDNTDAEGRLILADALAYASNLKPKAVIDLATLTGACVVALGSHAAGMMGNDEDLMRQLTQAGERTFERVWPLPLFEEYEKQIKSDIADVKNVGGRAAGAITAGLFLKRFIGDYRWAHLDIAGPAILEDSLPYTPKGGSGFGVRLLVDFLKHWKDEFHPGQSQ